MLQKWIKWTYVPSLTWWSQWGQTPLMGAPDNFFFHKRVFYESLSGKHICGGWVFPNQCILLIGSYLQLPLEWILQFKLPSQLKRNMKRIRLEQSIFFIHCLIGNTAKVSSLLLLLYFQHPLFLSYLKVYFYLRLVETTCSFTGRNFLEPVTLGSDLSLTNQVRSDLGEKWCVRQFALVM